jgi:acetolactate synthase small subunit
VKVELRFKSISAVSTDYLVVTIEGEPQKVHELLEAIEEKAKTWESWEQQ